MGKYAAKNRPARAVRHFSRILDRKVPVTTARRLKSASDESHNRREQGERHSSTGEQFAYNGSGKASTSWTGARQISPGLHQRHEESGKSCEHCKSGRRVWAIGLGGNVQSGALIICLLPLA